MKSQQDIDFNIFVGIVIVLEKAKKCFLKSPNNTLTYYSGFPLIAFV